MGRKTIGYLYFQHLQRINNFWCRGRVDDGVYQAAWLFAVLYKFVAIGGAFLAVEPIVVVSPYYMYKERLSQFQGIGIIISVLRAIALSIIQAIKIFCVPEWLCHLR
ncbi:MAG: hypothetical protein QXK65_02195 [Candidatus Micrarchaeaceae archaeon]